jgi:plastocyanin
MKRKSLIVISTVVMSFLFLTGVTPSAQEEAEEMELITKTVFIKPYEVLQPPSLTSKQGTTIIWVNNSKFPVKIHFINKKVALACGSPSNFSIGEDGTYETARTPRGGTASLCFLEKGKYTYIVTSSRTLVLEYGKQKKRKESRGTIIIK